MERKTLIILAAGIGSRFGGGIKQLEPVDDQGHLIIDYSIHDAIKAGFNRIVFIIRHDIEDDFKAAIGNRITETCKSFNVEIDYAFQEMSDIPGTVPEGRTKPWGTGHAVLSRAKTYWIHRLQLLMLMIFTESTALRKPQISLVTAMH